MCQVLFVIGNGALACSDMPSAAKETALMGQLTYC